MATYEYRCPGCGVFEVRRPMGSAQTAPDCPTCGGVTSRVFSVPHVVRTSPTLARLRTAEERSAHEPQVVNQVPARAAAPPPRTARARPGFPQLPRP